MVTVQVSKYSLNNVWVLQYWKPEILGLRMAVPKLNRAYKSVIVTCPYIWHCCTQWKSHINQGLWCWAPGSCWITNCMFVGCITTCFFWHAMVQYHEYSICLVFMTIMGNEWHSNTLNNLVQYEYSLKCMTLLLHNALSAIYIQIRKIDISLQ